MTIYVFRPEGNLLVVYGQERIATGNPAIPTRPGQLTPTGATFPKSVKGWNAAMDHVGNLNEEVAKCRAR